MRDCMRERDWLRPKKRSAWPGRIAFGLGLAFIGTAVAINATAFNSKEFLDRLGFGPGPDQTTSAIATSGSQTHIPLALPGQPTPTEFTPAEPVPDASGPAPLELPLAEPEPQIEAAPAPAPVPAAPTDDIEWASHEVASGDSLAAILGRMGVTPLEIHNLVRSDNRARGLTRIRPGQVIRVALNDQGNIDRLTHEIDRLNRLEVYREGDSFRAEHVETPVERRSAHASATIEQSLFLSAQSAGLPDAVTMELATIFGWDIDFALDVRTGDSFSLIYEELYVDGEKVTNGDILAAEFVNNGTTFRAVRYTDPDGYASYFTPEGKSMRKAFLRTPVKFSRISSRFSLGRKHPILNKIRAHKGVDYAAPSGTPVRATGDGKIVHRAKKGGYGKTVVVQHGTRYRTLYAHLSRYAKAREGARVKQGQVIGYVGKTGLATGPHLHYEFHVNGAHRNPLKVKVPAAEPIAKEYREDFLSKSKSLLGRLDTVTPTVVALNENE